jgi:hypothetical protein
MFESVRIGQQIKEAEHNIEKMRHQQQVALKIEEQREFLLTKKELFNNIGFTQYPPDKIGNMAGNTQLAAFFEAISLHLGYPVSVPLELGIMTITQLLIAVDIINNDERFQKYRGDLFAEDLAINS